MNDIKSDPDFRMYIDGIDVKIEYKYRDLYQVKFNQVKSNTINVSRFIKRQSLSSSKQTKCHTCPGARFYLSPKEKGFDLYFFFEKIKARGGFSTVYSGYQIDHTSLTYKKVVLKSPAYNNNQDVLLQESDSLDRLYGDDEKLDFIQSRFKKLIINRVLHLITKQYEGDLRGLIRRVGLSEEKLNLRSQFNCFKQMVGAVHKVIKRGFMTLDVKTNNALYEKDSEGNIHVFLCDINPFTKEDLKKDIEGNRIKPTRPVTYTTATNLRIQDLTVLSRLVGKYTEVLEIEKANILDDYFNLAEKMVVYQLGLSCFLLITQTHLLGTNSLCQLNKSDIQASYLDSKEIKNILAEKIKEIKNLEENKPYLTALDKIHILLIKTLSVQAERRLSIDELNQEVSQIKALLNFPQSVVPTFNIKKTQNHTPSYKIQEKLTFQSQINYFKQFNYFKQKVWEACTAIKKGFIPLNMDTNNAFYEKDLEGDSLVGLCDINLFTKEDLRTGIENELIKIDKPLPYTIGMNLTIHDLTDLSRLVGKYAKASKLEKAHILEDYFNLAEKMVVYQLGLACFFLITETHLLGTDSLCQLNQSHMQASCLDSKDVKNELGKRIKEIKSIEENKPYITILDDIHTLLIKILEVQAKQRLSMNELLTEVNQFFHPTPIEGNKRELDEYAKLPISPIKKQKMEVKKNPIKRKKIEWDVINVLNSPEKELKITEEDVKEFLQDFSENISNKEKLEINFSTQVVSKVLSNTQPVTHTQVVSKVLSNTQLAPHLSFSEN